MIKQIVSNHKVLSPVLAVKTWELDNRDPDDLVLLETYSASVATYNPPEEFVAYEYVDFYSGSSVLNRTCNIALEQQENDMVDYEEGISGSGYFDPENEATNARGTYKRLVHDQVSKAFYNHYHNPLKLFGMENIDIPLSRTQRIIANEFLMFTIPRRIMGDKLVERSIYLADNLLDDNADITDDGYGNIIARENLFARIQEVRPFGCIILSGSVSNSCANYVSGGASGELVIISETSGAGGTQIDIYTENDLNIYPDV